MLFPSSLFDKKKRAERGKDTRSNDKVLVNWFNSIGMNWLHHRVRKERVQTINGGDSCIAGHEVIDEGFKRHCLRAYAIIIRGVPLLLLLRLLLWWGGRRQQGGRNVKLPTGHQQVQALGQRPKCGREITSWWWGGSKRQGCHGGEWGTSGGGGGQCWEAGREVGLGLRGGGRQRAHVETLFAVSLLLLLVVGIECVVREFHG